MEYDRYDAEHAEIYDTESSDRAFEEEVMLSGFGNAPTKAEGVRLILTQQMKFTLHVIRMKQLH